MEIWKEWIENPKYLISSEGKIKGLNGKIMKTKNNNGYECVNLRPNPNNQKTYSVHRLVAQMFLDDFNSDYIVDHINGIKTDNRIENLRMTTPKMNLNYASINWNNIQNSCQQIVQKYGYDFLDNKLKELLDV